MGADAEAVEEVVESYARQRLADPAVRAHLDALSANSAGNASEVIALEARLTELEGQLAEPGVPVAAILRAMDRTREQMGQLHAEAAPGPIPSLRGDWPTDLARRARLVRLVVERVTVLPASGVSGRFDPERVVIDGL